MKLAFVIYKKNIMNQVKLFIELTRLKKPIGFMLLFWPCVWGLTIVNDFNSDLGNYFFFVFLFLANPEQQKTKFEWKEKERK